MSKRDFWPPLPEPKRRRPSTLVQDPVSPGKRRSPRKRRRTPGQVERLETRRVLAAPSFTGIAGTEIINGNEVIQVEVRAGAPLNIALNGFDADPDALTFSAEVINESSTDLITPLIENANETLQLFVRNTDPSNPFEGEMRFELFDDRAPLTTANIKAAVNLGDDGIESNDLDGILFHRVSADFVIQTGDPDGDGAGGALPRPFDDEFNETLLHTSKGILSMANTGDDSNNSQFFITDRATRFLDTNHAVFGFQTIGDDVREMIQNVPVDNSVGPGDGKPLSDVELVDANIIYDESNRVLSLVAPHGMTGEATIRVTVSDGMESTTHDIEITVVPDGGGIENTDPFLTPVADVETTSGVPVTFQIDEIDPEGDAPFFSVAQGPVDEVTFSVDAATGEVTATPSDNFAGVFEAFVGVFRANDPQVADPPPFDTQIVPVLIKPTAPTSFELVGAQSGPDGPVTALTNADPLRALTFEVDGVYEGAVVGVFVDQGPGVEPLEIARAEVPDPDDSGGGPYVDGFRITTDGITTLDFGQHTIFVSQAVVEGIITGNRAGEIITLFSDTSESTLLTVVPPAPGDFESQPVTAATTFTPYSYDVQTDYERLGIEPVYSLLQSPEGMTIDPMTGVIDWTPGAVGVVDVEVQVVDLFNQTTTQPFQIDVTTAENFEPSIDLESLPVDVSIDELQPFSFTVTAQDANLPNDVLTFSLAGPTENDPAPDGATIDPTTGLFEWTPTEEQGGTGTPFDFTVIVTDAGGLKDTAEFSLTVDEVNTAPVFDEQVEDQHINVGDTLTVDLEFSDSDLPANVLMGEIVGDDRGAIFDVAAQQFTWTPGVSDGVGPFDFTLRLSDGIGGTPPAEMTFSVSVNQAPEFTSEIGDQIVGELTELELQFAADDPNIGSGMMDTLTFSIAGETEFDPAPDGAMIDPVTGLFRWTPSEEQGAAPGLEFPITVIVTDSFDLTATTDFTVTVNEVNTPPTIEDIENQPVPAGERLTVDVVVGDVDIPANELTVSIVDPLAGQEFDAVLMQFVWNVDESVPEGPVDVTLQVSDGVADPVETTFTVFVTGPRENQPPAFTSDFGEQTVDEFDELTLQFTAEDPDNVGIPENEDPVDVLFFSLDGDVPDGATIDPDNGLFTWTPNEEQGGAAEPFRFDVVVTDSGGLTDRQELVIHAGEVNAPPTIGDISDQLVNPEGTLRVDVVTDDPDLPANDLIVTIVDPLEGQTFDPVAMQFVWTLTETQTEATYDVTLRVEDREGIDALSAEMTFTVHLNQGPEINSAVSDQTIDELQELALQFTATDPNLPPPLGGEGPDETLMFSLAGETINDPAPAGATIDPVSGLFRWTPTESQGAETDNEFPITVIATDSLGLTATTQFTVTVNEVNLAPTIGDISDQLVNPGGTLMVPVEVDDLDVPANDLTVTIVDSLEGQSFDPVTMQFVWNLTETQTEATYEVTLRVEDREGDDALSAETTFTVHLNQGPEITSAVSDQTIDELQELTLQFSADDPNLPPPLGGEGPVETLIFSLAGPTENDPAPAGATIDPVSGFFRWTPTELQGAETDNEFPITVIATDSLGLTATTQFTVTVNEVNVTPTIGDILDQLVNPGGNVTIDVAIVDPDLPANTLTITIVDQLDGQFFDESEMQFVWNLTESQTDETYDVTLRVTDGKSDPVETTFTVHLNQRPEITSDVSDQIVDELDELRLQFTADDPNLMPLDPDAPPEDLTFSLADGFPEGATIDPVSGLFRWTPSEGQGNELGLEYDFTVVVTDSLDLTEMTNFKVTVNEVNTPPSFEPIADQLVNPGGTLVVDVSVDDPDLPANGLSGKIIDALEGQSFDLEAMEFTWNLTEAQTDGPFDVTLQVTDGKSDPVETTFRVHLNQGPEITSAVSDQSVDELAELQLQFTADDPNFMPLDENGPAETLTFSLAGETINDPAPLGATIDPVSGLFRWTPSEEQGDDNEYAFTVIVTDLLGESDTTNFVVTVNEVNTPPDFILIDGEISDHLADVGEELPIDVPIFDPDLPADSPAGTLNVEILSGPFGSTYDHENERFVWSVTTLGGDQFTIEVIGGPDHGSLTLNQDGSFSYTPDPDFAGDDSFTYALTSLDELSTSTATVTIHVNPQNDAPVGAEDTYAVDEAGVLTVDAADGVLKNDDDAEGDGLTAVIETEPANGTLTLNDDGSFVYEPESGITGDITFSYRASDGLLDSDPVTVTITVTPAATPENTFPLAENSPVGTSVGTIDVPGATNDTLIFEFHDPNLAAELRLALDDHFAGDMAAPVVLIEYIDLQCPACATFHSTIDDLKVAFGDQLLVVTRHLPQLSNSFEAARAAEAAGRQGMFDAMVEKLFEEQDEWGAENDAEELRKLFGTYALDLNLGDLNKFRDELEDDTGLTDRVQRDLDAAQTGLGLGATPTFFLNGEQLAADTSTTDLTPLVQAEVDAIDQVFSLNRETGEIFVADSSTLDFETTSAFSLAIDATNGATTALNVTINLMDVNEAPTAVDDSYHVGQDGQLAISADWGVLANDSDIEGDSLTATLMDSPSNGNVELMDDGSFVYTPDEGFDGTDSFTYHASDGEESATATVMIEVTPEGNVAGAFDDSYSMDEGETLNIDAASGVLANDGVGDGPFLVTLQVSDGLGAMSDPESFAIVVNQAPVVEAFDPPSVDEGTELVFAVPVTDPNVSVQQAAATPLEGEFVDSLLFEFVGDVPEGMMLDPGTGEITWTPGEDVGPTVVQVTVRVTDSQGLDVEVPIEITVNEVNTQPMIPADLGSDSAFVGEMVTMQVTATDDDLPENSLTFSLVDPPEGASIDPDTGMLSFTPPASLVEEQVEIRVRVTDNGDPELSSDEGTFMVQVLNSEPALEEIAAGQVDGIAQSMAVVGGNRRFSVAVGQSLNLDMNAADVDAPPQSLSYRLVNPPAGASIDPATGVISFTPSGGHAGQTIVIEVEVADSAAAALSDTETFMVRVVDLLPIATADVSGAAQTASDIGGMPGFTMFPGEALTLGVGVADPDLPVQTLTYSLLDPPAGASIDATTGLISFDPSAGLAGQSVNLTVQITDPGAAGLIASETFGVSVIAPSLLFARTDTSNFLPPEAAATTPPVLPLANGPTTPSGGETSTSSARPVGGGDEGGAPNFQNGPDTGVSHITEPNDSEEEEGEGEDGVTDGQSDEDEQIRGQNSEGDPGETSDSKEPPEEVQSNTRRDEAHVTDEVISRFDYNTEDAFLEKLVGYRWQWSVAPESWQGGTPGESQSESAQLVVARRDPMSETDRLRVPLDSSVVESDVVQTRSSEPQDHASSAGAGVIVAAAAAGYAYRPLLVSDVEPNRGDDKRRTLSRWRKLLLG